MEPPLDLKGRIILVTGGGGTGIGVGFARPCPNAELRVWTLIDSVLKK